MKKEPHVLDFITAAYKFVDKWGITSSLIVDKHNYVSDISEDVCVEPPGIIAEIQNINGEYLNKLLTYYIERGDVRNINRTQKVINTFRNS